MRSHKQFIGYVDGASLRRLNTLLKEAGYPSTEAEYAPNIAECLAGADAGDKQEV